MPCGGVVLQGRRFMLEVRLRQKTDPDARLMRHFPAVRCSLHHSPIDALVALGVPREEAMALVTATWHTGGDTIFARIQGGRPVVAIGVAAGRWAACNAFPDKASTDPGEAKRQLDRLLKRGRQGYVAAASAAALAP